MVVATTGGFVPTDGVSRVERGAGRRITMFRSISKALKVFILGAGALSVAAGAAAQPTTTKETVPAGAATVTKKQLKGEVVAVGSNWLVAKIAPSGDYRVFTVAPNKTAMIDGVAKTVSELQNGTMLTADVTITEYPLVKRTTTVNSGTVFWASATSLIITQENGENKQYNVPSGFKFDVDGQKLEAMQLRPGMKLTGSKVVEEPIISVTHDSVVTGTAPK
jgi:hypothetical protein